MANWVFLLLAIIVILLLVLADNARHFRLRSARISNLIRDVEVGSVKYKNELLRRLKDLK